MADERLLPCPFCGGPATLDHGATDDFDVSCRNRKCFGPRTRPCAFSGDAIAMWNRRTDTAEPVAIKPLEWAIGPRYTGTESAASIFGTWSVWEMGGTGCYKPPEGSVGRSVGSNVADAKAAAQADYEARIRSALTLPA